MATSQSQPASALHETPLESKAVDTADAVPTATPAAEEPFRQHTELPPLALHPSFWDSEATSPLLRRNRGFVRLDNAEELCGRARSWLLLIPPRQRRLYAKRARKLKNHAKNTEMDRLFAADAERTFFTEGNRRHHVLILNTLFRRMKQYHQGLGFCVAFLQLFLNTEETIIMIHYLSESLLEGYFEKDNEKYLRDAMVFEKLLDSRDHDLADHLSMCEVVWAAICSKWWIGMNLHVLPFDAMFRWYDLALARGVPALFEFGISLCERNRQELMRTYDLSVVTKCLRFDVEIYKDQRRRQDDLDDSVVDQDEDGSFYTDIVENLTKQSISMTEIDHCRALVQVHLDKLAQRRKAMEELYPDDEIVFSDEEDEEDGEKNHPEWTSSEEESDLSSSESQHESGICEVIETDESCLLGFNHFDPVRTHFSANKDFWKAEALNAPLLRPKDANLTRKYCSRLSSALRNQLLLPPNGKVYLENAESTLAHPPPMDRSMALTFARMSPRLFASPLYQLSIEHTYKYIFQTYRYWHRELASLIGFLRIFFNLSEVLAFYGWLKSGPITDIDDRESPELELDVRAFEILLQQRSPAIYDKVQPTGYLPRYLKSFWLGATAGCFPFSSTFSYVSRLMKQGVTFHFGAPLVYLLSNETRILKAKSRSLKHFLSFHPDSLPVDSSPDSTSESSPWATFFSEFLKDAATAITDNDVVLNARKQARRDFDIISDPEDGPTPIPRQSAEGVGPTPSSEPQEHAMSSIEEESSSSDTSNNDEPPPIPEEPAEPSEPDFSYLKRYRLPPGIPKNARRCGKYVIYKLRDAFNSEPDYIKSLNRLGVPIEVYDEPVVRETRRRHLNATECKVGGKRD